LSIVLSYVIIVVSAHDVLIIFPDQVLPKSGSFTEKTVKTKSMRRYLKRIDDQITISSEFKLFGN